MPSASENQRISPKPGYSAIQSTASSRVAIEYPLTARSSSGSGSGSRSSSSSATSSESSSSAPGAELRPRPGVVGRLELLHRRVERVVVDRHLIRDADPLAPPPRTPPGRSRSSRRPRDDLRLGVEVRPRPNQQILELDSLLTSHALQPISRALDGGRSAVRLANIKAQGEARAVRQTDRRRPVTRSTGRDSPGPAAAARPRLRRREEVCPGARGGRCGRRRAGGPPRAARGRRRLRRGPRSRP